MLAPLFSQLPKAVLGAIIIDAVVFGMIDIRELRRLYRVTRVDFWIAVAAIVGVLSAGVLAGVVVGVVLSLIWLIYVATRPAMPLLGRELDTQVFRDLSENPDDETYDGVVVLRLDGGLFFATADALENRIRSLVDADELRALVLDLEGVNFVDSQGSAKLAEIQEFLRPAASRSASLASSRRCSRCSARTALPTRSVAITSTATSTAPWRRRSHDALRLLLVTAGATTPTRIQCACDGTPSLSVRNNMYHPGGTTPGSRDTRTSRRHR